MVKLKPVLSLFDALNIALGAIIGAGIFVIIGVATALSGPAIFLSVIVAGIVAILTGISTAELSKKYPHSGGAYTFARKTLPGPSGFLVGWVWMFSNVCTGATVAIGFGSYLAFFFPSVPINLAAAAAVVVATLIQLAGARQSAHINNFLVIFKILVLLVFVALAFSAFHLSNFHPLLPLGIGGVFAGAAAIFFAYSGFARVAVMADEIKDPKKNVPAATLLSIGISTAIYVVVAIAAVGLAGSAALAASDSPLAAALSTAGFGFGAALIAAGALVATGTVLLASVLGVSRVAQTMAQDGLLPAPLAALDRKTVVPSNSILLSGAVMLFFALFLNLMPVAYISSFSLLLYYGATNLSGIKALGGKSRYVAGLGVLSCIVLIFCLPSYSWLAGVLVMAAGLAYLLSRNKFGPRIPRRK
jgi:APA family basic amino acid/polyamine antiporter